MALLLWIFTSLTTLCCTMTTVEGIPVIGGAPVEKCERLDMDFCTERLLNYTYISRPNLYEHASQRKADHSLRPHVGLVRRYGFASELLLHKVWCAMLAPPCQRDWLPPCRAVCKAAFKVFAKDHSRAYTAKEMSAIHDALSCGRLPSHHRALVAAEGGGRKVTLACQLRFEEELQERVLGLYGLNSWVDIRKSNRTKKRSGTNNKKNKKKKRKSIKTNVPEPHGDCHCNNITKSTKRIGRQIYFTNKYDYAIKAKYEAVDGLDYGAPKVVKIRVESVLKSPKVNITIDDRVTLWAETGCVCQKLLEGKQYLFLGYEDKKKRRLLFDDTCMAVKWKDSWKSRIDKWEKKMKNRKRRKMIKKKNKQKELESKKNLVRTSTNRKNINRKEKLQSNSEIASEKILELT